MTSPSMAPFLALSSNSVLVDPISETQVMSLKRVPSTESNLGISTEARILTDL